MKIKKIHGGHGRRLHGTMVCEHCDTVVKFADCHNNAYWHEELIPRRRVPLAVRTEPGEIHPDWSEADE